MVATRDIERGGLVLFEDPLHVFPKNYSNAVLENTEYQQAVATIVQCASTHGHLSGPDAYPPEARHALDRLTELSATESAKTSPCIDDIWHLEDAHRCAEVGDTVMVDGLQSEGGKKLNGKKGRVVGIDETDEGRLAIKIDMGRASKGLATKKSMKRSNLKTLGGILRTNSFGGKGACALLYKTTCRINHACGKAANVRRMEHNCKAYIFAKREIYAGEEIFIDYLPNDDAEEDRPGDLQMKYNFRCQCSAHDHSLKRTLS